jgi:hypothetical protein
LSTELSAYAYSFLFSEKLLKFMYEICSYCFINEISPVQTHLPLPDFSYTTLFRIPTIKMVITILVVMSKISLNLGLRKRQEKKRKKKGKIKKRPSVFPIIYAHFEGKEQLYNRSFYPRKHAD